MKNITSPPLITMKDVANRAGVSTATVSRTFTAPEKVSIKTRQRVEAAAYALGYSFSTQCREEQNHYLRKIIVLVADIADSFYGPVIQGIEKQAAKNYCIVYLFDCAQQPQDADFLNQHLLSSYHDGILCLGTYPTQTDKTHLPPLVVINEYSSNFTFPMIHIDNLTAAFNAVNYLIQRGHRRIACLTGPDNLSLCRYRRQGYIQALQRHNIEVNPYYLARGDFTFQAGIDGLNHFMQLTSPPEAIFCHNDKMALGILYQAQQLGISIPDQLSVIGFDGLEEGLFSNPPLTTIVQPREALGEAAISLLIELMDGKPVNHSSCLLETELVLRQSTRS